MANVLTVRDPQGPVRSDVVDLGTSPRDRDAPRLVLLIHGYNNAEGRASESYDAFCQALDAVVPTGIRGVGAVWEFYWPGDVPSRPLARTTYLLRLRDARFAGEVLGRTWLSDRKGQTVYLIAHSMGCRVALEAVRTIAEERARGTYDGADIRAVFLFAAAVPETMCTPDVGWFPASLPGSREYVFYSRSDRVLQVAFRIGQRRARKASGDRREGAPAVGRDGRPDGRWASRIETDFGHEDYWGSRDLSEDIYQLLVPGRWREIDRRRLPTRERQSGRQLLRRLTPLRVLRGQRA